jgi:hypothetical protein
MKGGPPLSLRSAPSGKAGWFKSRPCLPLAGGARRRDGAAMSARPDPRRRNVARTSERRTNLLIRLGLVVPLAVTAFLLLGFANIYPVSVSSHSTALGTDVPSPCYGCVAVIGSVNLPEGRNVTLKWTDTSGGVAGVQLVGPGFEGPSVRQCADFGSSGECAFHSAGGSYFLSAYATGEGQYVSFTATWYVALP